MKTPHKHCELIKAWADGHEIELKYDDHVWRLCHSPNWQEGCDYRVKPEPKPDTVCYGFAFPTWWSNVQDPHDNIKITFSGETGKLKSAEVIS